MNRPLLLMSAALALSVAPGCKTSNTPSGEPGGSTEKAPLTQDDGPASAKGPDVLVFVPGPAAKPGEPKPAGQTIWYTISGDALEEVARAPGRVVASKDGAMWRYAARSIETTMLPCDRGEPGDSGPEPSPRVTLLVPTFGPVGPDAKRFDVKAPFPPGTDPTKEEYFEFGVEDAYQLGEYLFVNVGMYYECGAHPSYAVDPMVVSLEDGSVVALSAFVEGFSGELDDERAAAYAKMDQDVVDSQESELRPTRFTVSMSGGAPKLRVQMTGSTSYVAHDDSWDSYSMSRTVDMDGVPAALAPAVEPPAPLRAMFAKEGAYFEHSVFMAPAAKRAELLAAFEALE
jgi:hypothetical protein